MTKCCKCDMHVCWENIYEWLEHAHRDPVANVVIYSSIAFFLGFVSVALGAALYVVMDIPCSLDGSVETNDVLNAVLTWNSCHVIIPMVAGIFLVLVSAIGIAAGEIHISILYSIFGGTAIASIFFELYAFAATVANLRRNNEILDTVQTGLASALCVSHGISLYSIIMAVRFCWIVNYHFSRQEKMIEAEQVKRDNAATPMDLKLDFTMAKTTVEDDEIQTKGLQKSLLMVQHERAKSQMSTME